MNVFLDMVGCRLNQSELENYARQFRFAGHTLVSSPESADLVVINTCTVTSAAASDSRQKVRQAARLGSERIVLTGCWAALNASEAARLPGVSQVVGNDAKDDLVPIVLNLPVEAFKHPSSYREPIPGSRLRTRAFIKVQDGCDNFCTYCVTRLARGAGRSLEVKHILADIRSAQEGGAQEFILTGVHLGSWGSDFVHPLHLTDLLIAILSETDTPRLRLSSLEPWDITPAFFILWQNPRLCRHLHLPLQSGCEATLKRMGRHITPQSFADLVSQARQLIPGISISTDIITGFPGETEDEFKQSAAFIEEMQFSAGHVFTFSPRSGTPAAQMPLQVPHGTAKQRSALLHSLLKTSASCFRQSHLGQRVQVLVEKAAPCGENQWELSGLTENYLRVVIHHFLPCYNQLVNARVSGLRQDLLAGELIPH